MLGRKGVKRFLLVGHEKATHGSGLTGHCGHHTVDGDGTEGLLLPFLRYGTPDWAKGRRKDCEFLGILKNCNIFSEDIKSLL